MPLGVIRSTIKMLAEQIQHTEMPMPTASEQMAALLMLPESYKPRMASINADMGLVYLVVEHPDLPDCETLGVLPQLNPIYKRSEGGTATLEEIKVEMPTPVPESVYMTHEVRCVCGHTVHYAGIIGTLENLQHFARSVNEIALEHCPGCQEEARLTMIDEGRTEPLALLVPESMEEEKSGR